jgi:hypothetical protein
MKTTNLKLRKMSLIEYLLGIQDEKVFDKIESSIHKTVEKFGSNDIVFTKNDLIERDKFSNNQIEKGLVLSQEELKIQSKNW